jgi:tetratricopeptide (TPR) repeat protein
MRQIFTRIKRNPNLTLSVGLILLTVLVYLPIITAGGFIWDDDNHITNNPVLRTLRGLAAIWIHPTSIPQYYPIIHTTFWIEYHLWGLWPVGYHLDNVLLHAGCVVLLFHILRKLNIPGALAAAAIFTVHPVCVESVAWATERKNLLSGFLYLMSLWSFLQWNKFSVAPQKPRMYIRGYIITLLLFIAALLSKSITCSLPAAILLIIYWRDGRIRVRDILPLIPFFVIGICMAAVTGYLEKSHVGAIGDEWHWTFIQRCMIASRAVWFYAGKLFWPADLSFIYPKWSDASLASSWGWGFAIAVIAVLAGVWILRKSITRGPLAAVLFFIGTLVPALGFVNVFPMRYTFVADHYQYLASIGLIVLVVGSMATAARHWREFQLFVPPLTLVALCALATTTLNRQSVYKNELGLWNDTFTKNPNSFMVVENLGIQYGIQSEREDLPADQRAESHTKAMTCFQRLYEIAYKRPDTHWQMGKMLESNGDYQDAVTEFDIAIKLQPDFVYAMRSMANALNKLNRPAEALEYEHRALAINPYEPGINFDLGLAAEKSGDYDSAIQHYQTAIQYGSNQTDAEFNLGNLLMTQKNRPDLAVGYYSAAAQSSPNRYDIRFNFAQALAKIGQMDAAKTQCRIALQLKPDFAPAQKFLAQ